MLGNMITSYNQIPALKKAIIFYKGPLSNSIISLLGRKIQYNSALENKISRKVFTVYMELAENVLRYSDEEKKFTEFENGVGALYVCNYENEVLISTHNLVKNVFILDIKDQCNIINSLEHLDLREYKRKQRNQPRFSHSQGAGIGLIHSAIVSRSKIDIDIHKINNIFSYLTLTLKVKK